MSKKHKVVILGATGMLGHACAQRFESQPEKYETYVSYRKIDNLLSYRNTFYFDSISKIESWLAIPECDYVINCIGLIKQDPNATLSNMVTVNGTFPRELAKHCKSFGKKLIHISTDSVFSGKRGLYVETDVLDPVDYYGKSKLFGEGAGFMCLRTSIIGEELRGKRCILEWLKAHKGQTVDGYINQYWNGITAKEYAKMCDRIITNDLYIEGIRHVYTNVITKYHLLTMLREKLNIDVEIVPTNLSHKIDRTLVSEYDTNKMLQIPTIEQMIETDI